MGRLLLCAAVVALFFFAFSEAARHHENFSQGTYYDQTQQDSEKPLTVDTKDLPVDDKEKTVDTTTDKPQPAPVDTTIPNRYPGGYPGQDQYNTDFMDETNPEAAYSGYRSSHEQYNTVPNDNTDSQQQTIPDRYPHGYPGSENPLFSNEADPEAKFHEGKFYNMKTEDPAGENTDIPNRYPHGYYGNADVESKTQGEADIYTSHQTDKHASYFSTDANNYNSDSKNEIYDRYPNGYYGNNKRTGYSGVTTDPSMYNYQQNQVRYNQFPNNQPRYGYEGMEGDFSTQLQGNEIPFELTGGACPSEYWVTNPQRWPGFFNIKSKVTDAFGEKAGKVYGQITLLDALTDTRAEPYSKLVHSASTAILNSYSRAQYKLKHTEVIDSFNAALADPEAAKKQAEVFEAANVSVFSAGISGSCT